MPMSWLPTIRDVVIEHVAAAHRTPLPKLPSIRVPTTVSEPSFAAMPCWSESMSSESTIDVEQSADVTHDRISPAALSKLNRLIDRVAFVHATPFARANPRIVKVLPF